MEMHQVAAFQSLFPQCPSPIWFDVLYHLAEDGGIPDEEFGYVFTDGEVYLTDIRTIPDGLMLVTLKEIREKAYVLYQHEPIRLLLVSLGVENHEVYWSVTVALPTSRSEEGGTDSDSSGLAAEDGYTLRKKPQLLVS